MVHCKLCARQFSVITNTHLKLHNTTIKDYKKRFGPQGVGFVLSVYDLPSEDVRYKKWRKSLLNRPPVWSKGYTKESHTSLAKTSQTFKERNIDNFVEWRKANYVSYLALKRDRNLAFLIGMVLGDGNIYPHDRTEGLRITLGTDKPELWKYTAKIVEKIFKKKPSVQKVKGSACVKITLYQKEISMRLGIPTGNRNKITNKLPQWIRGNQKYLIAYLRGLYEAEGSFGVHEPTYTYKMIFTNKNDSLLDIVYTALVSLGFHPHRSLYKVQISKKVEVHAFKKLLNFRNYS